MGGPKSDIRAKSRQGSNKCIQFYLIFNAAHKAALFILLNPLTLPFARSRNSGSLSSLLLFVCTLLPAPFFLVAVLAFLALLTGAFLAATALGRYLLRTVR